MLSVENNTKIFPIQKFIETKLDETVINIYNLHSERRRLFILICLALAGLVLPFSDTVYLPALTAIEEELHTSTILVDYTISAYLITAGVFGLLWGPLGDRFGRKIILVVTFILFIGCTIVCTLTRSIVLLLIFRSLQGATIIASFVVGQSAIVDLYPNEKLGFAMGLFLVPLLIGPIVGPFVGGILANKYGWRSTFISLAIMAALATILILAVVPETQHYLVLKRLNRPKKKSTEPREQTRKITFIQAESMIQPTFIPPWRPFVFLADMSLTPHILVGNMNFAGLFVHFTLFSNRLAKFPYSLSPFGTGLCYIPLGVAALLGSIIGGIISDWSAKRSSHIAESRLLYNSIGALSCPIGLFICGWTFHYGVHISGPLIGSTLYSFGESFLFTGTCAFATLKKPLMTGAILALINSLSFFSAGIGIIVAVPILEMMNFASFYGIMTGISFLLLCISMAITTYRLRQGKLLPTADQDRTADSCKEPAVMFSF